LCEIIDILVHSVTICDSFRIYICDCRFYRVLAMVYSTQNYWVFGLFHHLVLLGIEKQCFGSLDPFPSSGGGWEKTPTQFGPLERANLNHCTTLVRFTEPFNHFQFLKRRVSTPKNTGRWKKSKNPVILCIFVMFFKSMKTRLGKVASCWLIQSQMPLSHWVGYCHV
jgi:hypothetical protein